MTLQSMRKVIIIHSKDCEGAQYNIEKTHQDKIKHATDLTKDKNQTKWLGQEFETTLLFFDCNTTANNLLALFGCVKAPHTLYLAYDKYLELDFFKRDILLPQLSNINSNSQTALHKQTSSIEKRNDEEFDQALSKIKEYSGVTHLIGERGSGKSTLLGQYIADLVTGKSSIIISAPSRAASINTFKAANINVSRETLMFAPAEKILTSLSNATTIIIDEAATYPRNTLNDIIKHVQITNKKLILATTIEGYEGTGQGYRINYLKSQENIVYLKTPRRFSQYDPLYQITKSIYNPINKINSENGDNHQDGVYVFSNIELREKGWTDACFSLLKAAHYKTTPNDLSRFYNDTALFVILVQNNKIISALYALPETIEQDIEANDIFMGTRRLKNALTQQALIAAYGDAHTKDKRTRCSKLNILRVSRVATDTCYLRKNKASLLIKKLKQYAKAHHYDAISTSFSGSEKSISFWNAQQFIAVRIGLHPNKINNEYAIIMMSAINEACYEIIEQYHGSFIRHINYFSSVYPQYCIKSFETNRKITKQAEITTLDNEISSIANGYRNINWLLPRLTQSSNDFNTQIITKLCDGTIRTPATKEVDFLLLQKLIDNDITIS